MTPEIPETTFEMPGTEAVMQDGYAKIVKNDYMITIGKSIFFQKEKGVYPESVFVWRLFGNFFAFEILFNLEGGGKGFSGFLPD